MKLLRAAFTLLLAITLALPAPAVAYQQDLRQRVETVLAQAPLGTRFGLVVTDDTGRELIAINPDGRFMPASNTKIFTTAAAYATLTGLTQPDAAGGASVRLEPARGGTTNVILTGRGDARLSSATDCTANCLATLADAVAARTRRVGDVIGDDSAFPDQRWSPGMSWNNIHTRSGTGISALTLDDNEVVLRVIPAVTGQRPRLEHHGYYRVENRVVTAAGAATALDFTRLPGSDTIRLTGTIRTGAEPSIQRYAVDDPAHFAAWRFKALLEARGVRVDGQPTVRRRAPGEPFQAETAPALAALTPPPLADDIARINKNSQNVHAELLLRRLGGANGLDGGIEVVAAMMARAGIARTGWDISDGSGMSTYNRTSPRAMAGLLRWIERQPWGNAWQGSLPIAGVDGTLTNRFRGTPLERRLFAKTGSINATNALSGYLIARSGRRLTFAFFANDVPAGAGTNPIMDAALIEIAAAN